MSANAVTQRFSESLRMSGHGISFLSKFGSVPMPRTGVAAKAFVSIAESATDTPMTRLSASRREREFGCVVTLLGFAVLSAQNEDSRHFEDRELSTEH
jgi:hypothetical protein